MEVEDTVIVEQSSVSCDGGGGPLGHPRVYLEMDDNGEVVCPYFPRVFKLAEGAAHAAGPLPKWQSKPTNQNPNTVS